MPVPTSKLLLLFSIKYMRVTCYVSVHRRTAEQMQKRELGKRRSLFTNLGMSKCRLKRAAGGGGAEAGGAGRIPAADERQRRPRATAVELLTHEQKKKKKKNPALLEGRQTPPPELQRATMSMSKHKEPKDYHIQ